jgi:hypothetical protein
MSGEEANRDVPQFLTMMNAPMIRPKHHAESAAVTSQTRMVTVTEP